MNVAACTVGFGVLCLLPVGITTQATGQGFSGPAFVVAGPADSQTAFELLHSIDLPFTMDGPKWPLAPAHKTLVIVPGQGGDEFESGDSAALINRVRMLIAQARKANVSVLLLHVGGRRSRNARSGGVYLDRLAADSADHIVVTGDGDFDGFFRSRATQRGIPVDVVAGIPEARTALMRLFKVGLRTSMGAVNSLLPGLATTRTRNGSRLDFASLRGRWVALHFWTTASGEIRLLKSHQDKYGARVQFVGVAVDSLQSAWRRTVDELPSNWLHVLNGKDDEDIATQLAVFALPTRFLIDPSGRIVVRSSYRNRELFIDPSGRIVGRFNDGDDEFFKKLAEIGK